MNARELKRGMTVSALLVLLTAVVFWWVNC